MPELEAKVPEVKTVFECQRCSRITDNPSKLCDVCLMQKEDVVKGGTLKYPEPKDDTYQNF